MSDHTPPTTIFFTDAELAQFKTEDFSAGKAVVILMIGIFSTGVVLYSLVALFLYLRMGFLA